MAVFEILCSICSHGSKILGIVEDYEDELSKSLVFCFYLFSSPLHSMVMAWLSLGSTELECQLCHPHGMQKCIT